jgi:hypothetical protein
VKTVDELVYFSSTQTPTGKEIVGVVTYDDSELQALANCLIKLPYGSRVVEIGTFAGRSASLYFQLQQDLNLEIDLVDVCMWHPEAATAIFNRMISIHFKDVPYNFYKVRSQELGTSWKLPINFLHVDGHHDLEFVWSDCDLWLPHIVPGGFAIFHDSQDAGVMQAINHFVVPAFDLIETANRTTTWKKREVKLEKEEKKHE